MTEIKITVVSFEQYTDYEFIDPATWFVMTATQDYYYFHTSKREVAQAKADELFGKGKYVVKTSKMQKTKSKLESGGLSCTGVSTRKGQKKY